MLSRTPLAIVFALAMLNVACDSSAAEDPKRAEHIVVIVFDGLRPDSVTPRDMPALYELARRGTTFANHHSVFPSSTEVNGTALATGGYPHRDGIMANVEYRPEIDPLNPVSMEEESTVRKGDQVSSGHYLLMPTVAEIMRKDGRATAIAGTKAVAILLDRALRSAEESKRYSVVYQGLSLPAEWLMSAPAAEPFPKKADAKAAANAEEDRWTTHVLTERSWAAGVPAFSMLWLSEPDYAQHGSGPGSDVVKQALQSDDDNLAALLAALDRAGVRNTTDVLVVSDHGFSTVSQNVDLVALLKAADFDAAEALEAAPKNGQILVVGLGGSASFYVVGHDAEIIRRLVQFLQKSNFAGVILTAKPMDGTFTLEQAGIDTAHSPDVMVSFRWSDIKNANGIPGQVISQGTKRLPGQGIHASLSPFDMHNTLIASGPDFKAGFVDELPSGNADIAPTVLWLLGTNTPSDSMDGRVLAEAIEHGPATQDRVATNTIRATATLGTVSWNQYLQVSEIGRHHYLDRGNAGSPPSH